MLEVISENAITSVSRHKIPHNSWSALAACSAIFKRGEAQS